LQNNKFDPNQILACKNFLFKMVLEIVENKHKSLFNGSILLTIFLDQINALNSKEINYLLGDLIPLSETPNEQ
jgi:hypothetical protein